MLGSKQFKSDGTEKVRYAVVGLGHIAQSEFLPAFRRARDNSLLAAIVSDDQEKLRELTRKYKRCRGYTYQEYDECLRSGVIDAVIITLPNDMHCEYTVRAAQAGIHVLCEKPMAVSSDECRRMISAATNVRLMIAYRLHFDAANLRAVEIARSGQIGEPRMFLSSFTMQVKPGNIRLQRERGGGTLLDIGVYCINAARYLFRDEPTEVTGLSGRSSDPRFTEVAEMTGAVMRFPNDRLAVFATSFGAAHSSAYRVLGTDGELRMEPAFSHGEKLNLFLTRNGKTDRTRFPKRDQFAAELAYFSKCVLEGQAPQPSGTEGLADVQVIEAIQKSFDSGRSIEIGASTPPQRPNPQQVISMRDTADPELVNVTAPRED